MPFSFSHVLSLAMEWSFAHALAEAFVNPFFYP